VDSFAFVDQLPKVELHLHLVGSASAPTVLELAGRHPAGGVVPRTEPELRAYYEFRDFPHFGDAEQRRPADVRHVAGRGVPAGRFGAGAEP
jgi:aminodeoxyfutalosine deaminase